MKVGDNIFLNERLEKVTYVTPTTFEAGKIRFRKKDLQQTPKPSRWGHRTYVRQATDETILVYRKKHERLSLIDKIDVISLNKLSTNQLERILAIANEGA